MQKLAPWYYYVAMGFGLGRLPVAPGTWGSLGAILVFIPLHLFCPEPLLGILVGFVIVSSFPICNWASAYLGQWDPGSVVLDEFAGLFLGLWPTFWTGYWESVWYGYLAGFLLFRFFDVTKFFPANLFDGMENGYGITLDDLVAGVYTNITLCLLGWWMF